MARFALALLACGLWAQERPRDPITEEVQAILDGARALPAELFADIAFRLIERVPQKEKPALLEEIFRRASEARNPVLLRFALPKPPGADAQHAVRTHALRLDALSLRCRSVRLLLDLDPKLARRLFERIPPLEAPRVACERAFAPEPSVYFETLASVVERGTFTKEERAKREPLWMMERAVRGITNSWEIAAAARLVPRLAGKEFEARVLAPALAASLAISDSDRSFRSAVWDGQLVPHFLSAAEHLDALGAPDLPLLLALRSYLVRHFSAPRCADGPDPAEFRFALPNRPDVPPITEEERKPAGSEGKATDQEYANAAEFQAMLAEIQALTRVPRGQNLAKVRTTPEWFYRARQALSKVQDWKGTHGQDAAAVFHQKIELLWRLFEAAPSGELFRDAMDELLAALDDIAALRRTPAGWLAEVTRLLRMQSIVTPQVLAELRKHNIEIGGFPFHSGLEIAQRLLGSRNAALSLYGRLEVLLKTPARPGAAGPPPADNPAASAPRQTGTRSPAGLR